jgi:hypothetical protein
MHPHGMTIRNSDKITLKQIAVIYGIFDIFTSEETAGSLPHDKEG